MGNKPSRKQENTSINLALLPQGPQGWTEVDPSSWEELAGEEAKGLNGDSGDRAEEQEPRKEMEAGQDPSSQRRLGAGQQSRFGAAQNQWQRQDLNMDWDQGIQKFTRVGIDFRAGRKNGTP